MNDLRTKFPQVTGHHQELEQLLSALQNSVPNTVYHQLLTEKQELDRRNDIADENNQGLTLLLNKAYGRLGETPLTDPELAQAVRDFYRLEEAKEREAKKSKRNRILGYIGSAFGGAAVATGMMYLLCNFSNCSGNGSNENSAPTPTGSAYNAQPCNADEWQKSAERMEADKKSCEKDLRECREALRKRPAKSEPVIRYVPGICPTLPAPTECPKAPYIREGN